MRYHTTAGLTASRILYLPSLHIPFAIQPQAVCLGGLGVGLVLRQPPIWVVWSDGDTHAPGHRDPTERGVIKQIDLVCSRPMVLDVSNERVFAGMLKTKVPTTSSDNSTAANNSMLKRGVGGKTRRALRYAL